MADKLVGKCLRGPGASQFCWLLRRLPVKLNNNQNTGSEYFASLTWITLLRRVADAFQPMVIYFGRDFGRRYIIRA